MGAYSFGVYEKPCPNCGGEVKYSWFAGDHYDNPSSHIYCDSEPEVCGATFPDKEKWKAYSGGKLKKDRTVRSGG